MPKHIQIPNVTASFVGAVLDLLGTLTAADPELLAELGAGHARVSFDAAERVIVVSVVEPGGRGRPVAAVQADPSDRDGFGIAGKPTPVTGLYEATTRH